MKKIANAYIGIDASLTGTGIAVLAATGKLIDHWTLSTSVKDGGLEVRLEEIHEHIKWLVGDKPRLVAMEGFAFGSANVAHTLGAVAGVVRLAMQQAKCPFILVPPTTLKKFATGQGTKMPKDQMAVHIAKRWGVMMKDNNQWDAYALAQMARCYFHTDRAAGAGELADRSRSVLEALSLPAFQRETIAKVETCTLLK